MFLISWTKMSYYRDFPQYYFLLLCLDISMFVKFSPCWKMLLHFIRQLYLHYTFPSESRDYHLASVKEMKMAPRGVFHYACDRKNRLDVVRQNANNVVSIVSNKVCVYYYTKSRQSGDSRDDGKRVDTGQPFLIKHYNKTMGEDDRIHQNVDKYSTAIRSNKGQIQHCHSFK